MSGDQHRAAPRSRFCPSSPDPPPDALCCPFPSFFYHCGTFEMCYANCSCCLFCYLILGLAFWRFLMTYFSTEICSTGLAHSDMEYFPQSVSPPLSVFMDLPGGQVPQSTRDLPRPADLHTEVFRIIVHLCHVSASAQTTVPVCTDEKGGWWRGCYTLFLPHPPCSDLWLQGPLGPMVLIWVKKQMTPFLQKKNEPDTGSKIDTVAGSEL